MAKKRAKIYDLASGDNADWLHLTPHGRKAMDEEIKIFDELARRYQERKVAEAEASMALGLLEHSDPSRPDYGLLHPGSSGVGGASSAGGAKLVTSNVDEAIIALAQGRPVELQSVDQVSVLLDRLAAETKKMAAQGKKAPNFDLCKVTVPGSSLFCQDAVTNPETGQKIPRVEMPQLKGKPRPGSDAAKLAQKDGEVDGTAAFVEMLTSRGVKVSRGRVKASHLKASQNELVGAKVAGMVQAANAGKFDPGKAPIFVSKDNYVIDGHHRWAAQVGRDASDGKLGDLEMKVIRLDIDIIGALKASQQFADVFGIQSKAGKR